MAGGLFALGDYVTNLVMGARYRRQQYQFQLRQHQMAIDNATRAVAEFEQQKSYNRAIMGQSFAARGISNSTIATQGTGNFDATAARREAALNQNLDLQNYGMTLLKTYHRYQQRMLVYNGFRALGETVVGAASLMSGGGAGDTGQEQGATSTNDPTAGGGSSDPEAMFNNVNADSPQSSSPEEMFSQPSYAGYGDQSGYGGPGSDYGGGSPD